MMTYTATIDGRTKSQQHSCGGCDWEGAYEDMQPLGHVVLTPGDPSPSGRCPVEDCESLCYPAETTDDTQTWTGPAWAWQTVFETLRMDMESKAFDPDLRDQIRRAYEAIS